MGTALQKKIKPTNRAPTKKHFVFREENTKEDLIKKQERVDKVLFNRRTVTIGVEELNLSWHCPGTGTEQK